MAGGPAPDGADVPIPGGGGGAPQVTPQVMRLLAALGEGGSDRAALQAGMGLSDRKSFRELYLAPALEAGLVEFTVPDKPNSRLQGYRLTEAGERARNS